MVVAVAHGFAMYGGAPVVVLFSTNHLIAAIFMGF
jgi:hypothetical protein